MIVNKSISMTFVCKKVNSGRPEERANRIRMKSVNILFCYDKLESYYIYAKKNAQNVST